MLIITNGDSALGAMDAAGVPGDKLAWRDVLHDGPVPAGLELDELSEVRAHFIASSGWGRPDVVRRQFIERDATLEESLSQDEVVLWFEHDLYDQLQLFQLLDWFSHRKLEGTRLAIVQDSGHISEGDRARLPDRLEERIDVTAAQLALGHLAWAAFTAPEPDALRRLLDVDTTVLPFLRPAVERLQEEYPDATSGLARSERQILSALEDGEKSAGKLFRAVEAYEEARYLGDASFLRYVERMASGTRPLLRLSGSEPFRLSDWTSAAPSSRLASPLELTETGRRVLAGELDWIEIAGIDRWIGGVHLRERVWRRDPRTGRIRLDTPA
jgi:hypothetical protein